MTTWPARRVEDGPVIGRLLCGRQVNGRYVCQGLVAHTASEGIPARVRVMLPQGLVEDPPGSRFWRQTSRATQRASERRGSVRRHVPKGDTTPQPLNEPSIPWQRACPHCRSIAIVTEDVLS
jgi:hypothetical protein